MRAQSFSSYLIPVALGLGLLFTGGPARADLPPPEGYVESCTVEQAQSRTGQLCESCGDAYHGDREACARKYEGTGFSRECQTAGASAWDEVWCDAGQPLSAEAKAQTDAAAKEQTAVHGSNGGADRGQKGCGCTLDGRGSGLAPLLALAGLLLLRRRER